MLPNIKTGKSLWLSYLSAPDATELFITVGRKPLVYKTVKMNQGSYVGVKGVNPTNKNIKAEEFHYELSKLLSNKKQWKKFLKNKNVYIDAPESTEFVYCLSSKSRKANKDNLKISKISLYFKALQENNFNFNI